MIRRMTVLACLLLVALPAAANDDRLEAGTSYPDGDPETSIFDPNWFCWLASNAAILTCLTTAEAACGEEGAKVVGASAHCGILLTCHWECNDPEDTSDQG